MRAFAVRRFGAAADGAFLIRVRYAGVNPIDYKLVERLTVASTYPFVMGIDFAGVVERAPAGERDLHAGDRIFGMARTHGARTSSRRFAATPTKLAASVLKKCTIPTPST
jgi:NADPH:quinone reductase-like Zn-dependent oxidoreductase